MIAKLTGILDSTGDDWLIVDVGGVGYLVHASSRTLSSLPPRGEAVRLHIETIVREDAFTLYGFFSIEERDMYRILTGVQGVGAKVGLAILSVAEPSVIQTAIAAGDKVMICQANGVGPKLGARIINELKDKVGAISFAGMSAGDALVAGAVTPTSGGFMDDAVSALANLGYRPVDAHGAVARAAIDLGDGATVQSLITAGLKELSKS